MFNIYVQVCLPSHSQKYTPAFSSQLPSSFLWAAGESPGLIGTAEDPGWEGRGGEGWIKRTELYLRPPCSKAPVLLLSCPVLGECPPAYYSLEGRGENPPLFGSLNLRDRKYGLAPHTSIHILLVFSSSLF